MHALPYSPHYGTLRAGEKFFLEAWFNLTHERSLDSYRVRYHNGRTILEELHREMGMPMASATDLGAIVAEAREICGADTVLQGVLGTSTWVVLEKLLAADANVAKGKPEDLVDPRKEQFAYVLEDVLGKLPSPYLKNALADLEAAIDAEKLEDILGLCDLIATDLSAHGWAVGSLHTWVRSHFLDTARQNIAFMERWRLFRTRVQAEAEDYTVTLELSGGKTLKALTDFAGFTFSANPPAAMPGNPGATPALSKFLQPNPFRIYASTTIKAVDQNAAAHEAVEKFAHCQDRLRFNYCDEPIVREGQRVLVLRVRDGRQKMVPLVYGIPNPEHHLLLPVFLKANKLLDDLFGSTQIEKNSQRRIEAAVRQYRLGLDAGGYPDKLLNWWMGLETLTNTEFAKGGIGERVVKNSVPLLCHHYFQTQLRTLSRVVAMALRKQWPAQVTGALRAPANPQKDLTWEQLLTVLRDVQAAQAVEAALATDHPWVQLRWKRFCDLAKTPDSLAKHLAAHEKRLRWHLQRLYRIRCCLVHGTPVQTSLQLPAANLEYYLREAIYRVLIAIGRSPNLHSLEAVFERATYCKERRVTALADKNADLHAVLAYDLSFSLAV